MNSLRVTSAGRSARRVVIWLAVGMLLETVSLASLSLGADSRDDEAPVDFALDVQPIFARSCQMCHGPQKLRGGLRLDERASVLAGGDSGEPAIAPGDVKASRLLERVSTDDASRRMPPKGERLSSGEIAVLKRWIAQGARWSESKAGDPVARVRKEMTVTDADREHWAFRPLKSVSPPTPRQAGLARTPLDRFLLAKLDAKSLTPAPEADRQTLIRRLSFDLIGLPPAPEQIQAFVGDANPNAYESLVDRLLASPHYGQRWGRHWLDVARFADSDGYENDLDRKAAFRYRDFVIRALNDDMPYDRFVRWQIAGDEYEPNNPMAVAATGFCTAAPSQDTTPADTDENKEKIRYDELDNMVATTGSALIGLTIGCARCHDHKFDPIPTRDYYRMLAAFSTSERREASLSKAHREWERWRQEQGRLYREARMQALGLSDQEKFWLRQPEHFFVPVQIELYKRYGKALEASEEQLVTWMTDAKRATDNALHAAVARAQAGGADAAAKGLVLLDRGAKPKVSYLLGRGSVTNKNEIVTFGLIQVLTRGASPEDYLTRTGEVAAAFCGDGPAGSALDPATLGTTYQRMALAMWVTDPERGAGGLLARVIVNRMWQHHFGEGLVRTPDDFGLTGDRPEQAELLDWLATELIRCEWRLKPVHRLILSTAAYRQGTLFDASSAAIDPENRLLWHRRPVRLEAEALRDAILACSGRLNLAMYGPPFRPKIPAEAVSTRSKDVYPTDIRDGPETWRRSIFAFVKRSVPNPLAEVFDAPDSTAACGRRNTTAVPTQNLALINDPSIRGCAIDLARRVAKDAGTDGEARVRRAFELVLGRPPRPDELDASRALVARGDAHEALADFCHVLFTLNEFLYIN
jgi:hypothetical protein